MPENTFFMIKPDGVSRGLQGEILDRVERTGLKVIQQAEHTLSQAMAKDLYSVHKGKPFYTGLVKFITSGPVVLCRLSGENAIERTRGLMGATDPREAAAGTIRGDLKEDSVLNADGIIKNLVHGSDGPESARRELAIFFK
ncbi:MAG: nucleoside-diphosphate kinase [Candidatus Saganbacteria bacterium]|nr:nucleoside-diphosphate kinase [Candidatus Saganbacteria bacterium]